jgi:CRP/FNR family cyclic AMP-dependent transcriptional regulator
MLETLPPIPLFQDLEPAQIDLLRPLFEQFSCPPETLIFEQGTPANYLYLIIKGDVAIRYKPYDSPPIILTRLRANDVFGWSAVIGSPNYTSSIISESQVECVRMKDVDLRTLIREHPETGAMFIDRLARVVSTRWKNAHAQVQSLLNPDNTI